MNWMSTDPLVKRSCVLFNKARVAQKEQTGHVTPHVKKIESSKKGKQGRCTGISRSLNVYLHIATNASFPFSLRSNSRTHYVSYVVILQMKENAISSFMLLSMQM